MDEYTAKLGERVVILETALKQLTEAHIALVKEVKALKPKK